MLYVTSEGMGLFFVLFFFEEDGVLLWRKGGRGEESGGVLRYLRASAF